MEAKEVFCELVEDSIEAAYCLPTIDNQQSVQNAEPRKLRNRNKRYQVGSKLKEKRGFKMKLRSHCVALDNSIHKNKHTANKLYENEDDSNKISQTKTKGASCRDDSFEMKSDSVCRRVSSKRDTSIVVNCSPESTKKKVASAGKSKSNKYSDQNIISGYNGVNKGHPRRSERLKRNSLLREFGGTPTKKRKVCTSSTDKSEVKNITPQTSAGAKENTEDTNLTATLSEVTKKADLSRDTAQSAIRKVFPTLVDHLDPKRIIDKMFESKNYRHSSLRDIMDNSNTSDRNRKLLDWISRRNVTVYTHFKECLLETKQNLLFKLLEIAEEDGDTTEITTHIIQNTIWLNSEGNKLYSDMGKYQIDPLHVTAVRNQTHAHKRFRVANYVCKIDQHTPTKEKPWISESYG